MKFTVLPSFNWHSCIPAVDSKSGSVVPQSGAADSFYKAEYFYLRNLKLLINSVDDTSVVWLLGHNDVFGLDQRFQ